MESHSICVLVFGAKLSRFIHVVECVKVSSLSRLSNIPLYGHTTLCSSIQLPLDTWVSSAFRLP